MTTRTRLVFLALVVMLLATAAGLFILYPRATRPLVYAHQQALVDRTINQAAKEFREPPSDLRRLTFPIVMELSDRTCVELRSSSNQHGAVGYLACYKKAGEIIEERIKSS